MCTLYNEWLFPSLCPPLPPSPPSQLSQLSPESLITLLYSAPLQSILRKLLDLLQHTPGAMREHEHTSMAASSTFSWLLATPFRVQATERSVYKCCYRVTSVSSPGQKAWQLEWNENSLTAGNLATITSFGEPLMEIVCRDASSGHDVARVSPHTHTHTHTHSQKHTHTTCTHTQMLSLALLDGILSIDYQGSWLRFMVAQRLPGQAVCQSAVGG